MGSDNKIRLFVGATAIVNGSASGIGRGLVEELAKQGCQVVLADRQRDVAEKVAQVINSAGGTATAVEVDVTDFQPWNNWSGKRQSVPAESTIFSTMPW